MMTSSNLSTESLYPTDDEKLRELQEEAEKLTALVTQISEFRQDYGELAHRNALDGRDAANKAVRLREAELLYGQVAESPDTVPAICMIHIGLPYQPNGSLAGEVRPVQFKFPLLKDGRGMHTETRALTTWYGTDKKLDSLLEKNGRSFIEKEGGSKYTAEEVFTGEHVGRKKRFALVSRMQFEVTTEGRLRLPQTLQDFTILDCVEDVHDHYFKGENARLAADRNLKSVPNDSEIEQDTHDLPTGLSV